MERDLFIGMTTWNSEVFLPVSLASLRRATDERTTRLVVLDNYSGDATTKIARSFGAEVVQRRGSQSMALIDLFNLSRSTYTLLIHADVVVLARDWLDVCTRRLTGNVALVSPEDIGCGPYTRPWGRGMPESSFLLFRTRLAARARTVLWRQRFKLSLPVRAIDLTGEHVTYNIPRRLHEHGLEWAPMMVHTSPRVDEPIYEPRFDAPMWHPELALYRYGLGNFYSVDGMVTHYHNWFERALEDVSDDSTKTLARESGGLPLAFLKCYTRNFLRDFESGQLQVPEVTP